MRNSVFILLLCGIVGSLSSAGVSDQPIAGEPRVFLIAVLDTSPTSGDRWDTRKALLLEAIHGLKTGDRLELLAARPGDPTVQLAEVMTEPLQLQRANAARVVSRIPKEWFASADIGRAVNTAHLSLLNKGEGYRCCLLVLTSGRIGESGLMELRRVSAALKPRAWPVCVVCDGRQAYKPVLVAGNKEEFEVRFTDSASVGQWIKSVRALSAPNRPVAQVGETPRTATPPPVVPAKPPEVPGPTPAPAPTTPDGKGPVDVGKVDAPPPSPKPAIPKAPKPPSVPRQKDADQKTHPDITPHRKIPIVMIAGGVLGIGLVALVVYILKDAAAVGKLRRRFGRREDATEGAGSQLVAFIGDRREELGNLEDILEITVGKGLGSNIYIDQPGVEEKHARIFRRRKGLRIQNTAGIPIVVGGRELPPKAKVDLVLPADIELAAGATISLLAEAVEPGMEVDNHEHDAA